MYAIVVGNLQKGQDFKEIEYKEIARAEEIKDLAEPFINVMTDNAEEKEVWQKVFAENKVNFISKPNDTMTMYGKDAVLNTYDEEKQENRKDGSGLRVRIVEID